VDIFLENFSYILFNSFLAFIAVLFGWLMFKLRPMLLRIICGFFWLIFLPNTIYILTDISHLVEDWPKVNILFKFLLVTQYFLFSIFGIISFVVSIYFFQKLLERRFTGWKIEKMKPSTFIAICILNFMVGFAVIMGGIERTNSWYIFTNPIRVLQDILDVLSSGEMLMLAGGIGILANIIYFLMLESVATWGRKYLKKENCGH
jgi:uncharacterized membrane protein